jgi:hypothetical protein
LTLDVLGVLHQFATPQWSEAVGQFLEAQRSLIEIYQRTRKRQLIPLFYQGQEYYLSPGKRNTLQVAIIEEFAPRFIPGATLVYLGDTANKSLLIDEPLCDALHIPISRHDKLPDIILYDAEQNRVYLIEAVTSHGPVTHKRRLELDNMLSNCPAKLIYISAFPDFATLRNFISEIAWESEVWLSEVPDHLIHFDGDRFRR